MSSTLQISLAVGGGLVLAGVVAHGAWSARKNLPKQPAPEPAPTPLPAQPPVFRESQPAAPAPAAVPAQAPETARAVPLMQPDDTMARRQEPSFEADSNLAGLAEMTALEKKPGLDVLIDAIASVSLESVISGEAALAAMPSTRRVGSKPFGVEGLSVASTEWEFPAAGQRYSAFQCGVQLANRTGALNQIEYSEFVIKTRAFADAIGGEAQFPEMLDEVARARELDQFASDHDAQLSMTLQAMDTAWSPGYVQQCAGRLGFVGGLIPGRMMLPASEPGHPPILVLSFDSQAAMAEDPEQTALREFSLALDVPQVLRAEKPFARMCEVALRLAAHMDGVIIDDDGNRIPPGAMEVIHADLEELYDRLDARDLSAGSVLGRRLFS
ncbi:MAG: cell division protein FtsZ [Pseudomonadota bacterium]|nr:cell division protein FtsZ [Pseudomonadota bacterium]